MTGDLHSAPVPRVIAALFGAISVLLGLPAALFGLLLIVGAATEKNPSGAIIGGVILCTVGCLASVLGVRLVLNRGRSDGGLVSPLAMRIAGACFLVCSPVLLIGDRSPIAILHTCEVIIAGIALLGIAARRENRHE
jgi:hypothetical protein